MKWYQSVKIVLYLMALCLLMTHSLAGTSGGDKDKWYSTTIGNRVSIGSNATILPVQICDDVVIGAGAVVTKDILKPGKYVGNPCRYLGAI